MRRFYLAYGLLILATLGVAEFRGWSLTPVNEVKNVPKSVRENPGSYRPVYTGSHRYIGGK